MKTLLIYLKIIFKCIIEKQLKINMKKMLMALLIEELKTMKIYLLNIVKLFI